MKNANWFVCPACGGVTVSSGDGASRIVCCGNELEPLEARKAEPGEKLSVELIDGSWFVSSDHPMTKDDYIQFVALANGEKVTLVRTFPEWNLQVTLPHMHGKLFWCSTQEGLRYQLV